MASAPRMARVVEDASLCSPDPIEAGDGPSAVLDEPASGSELEQLLEETLGDDSPCLVPAAGCAAVANAHQLVRRASWRLFQVAALSSAEALAFAAMQHEGSLRAALTAPGFLILGWLARRNVKQAFLIGAIFYAAQTLMLMREGGQASSLLTAYVGVVHCLFIYRMYKAYDLLQHMEDHGLLA